AGSPEWSCEPDAQDKLGERRLGDQADSGVYPLNEPADRLPSVAGDLLLQGHQPSPQTAVANAPASSNPPMLAARSNDGLSESAAEAAAPSDSPVMRRVRKAAPPGGSRRASTSRAGLVNRASSGSKMSTRLAEPSQRLAVKIVTAG